MKMKGFLNLINGDSEYRGFFFQVPSNLLPGIDTYCLCLGDKLCLVPLLRSCCRKYTTDFCVANDMWLARLQ